MSRLRIAHLSDPHFGTVLPGVQEGLLATLTKLRPDLVLLTGDITQRARRSQFRAARHFTEHLRPAEVIAVPGNHDLPLLNLWERFWFSYRGFKQLFKNQLEKDFVHGDVRIFGFNSTSKWRHVQGDFNLERLERRLKVAARTKVNIAAFHHPLDCKKKSDEKNLLRGRDEAVALFAAAEIDLAVGGHIHDPFVTLSSSRYPDIKRPFIISVAGTCLSWRIRPGAPNSFNLIDVDTASTPRIIITRYDQRHNLRFTPEESHTFVRTAEGWQNK